MPRILKDDQFQFYYCCLPATAVAVAVAVAAVVAAAALRLFPALTSVVRRECHQTADQTRNVLI